VSDELDEEKRCQVAALYRRRAVQRPSSRCKNNRRTARYMTKETFHVTVSSGSRTIARARVCESTIANIEGRVGNLSFYRITEIGTKGNKNRPSQGDARTKDLRPALTRRSG
jgi:hypothetical protein